MSNLEYIELEIVIYGLLLLPLMNLIIQSGLLFKIATHQQLKANSEKLSKIQDTEPLAKIKKDCIILSRLKSGSTMAPVLIIDQLCRPEMVPLMQ